MNDTYQKIEKIETAYGLLKEAHKLLDNVYIPGCFSMEANLLCRGDILRSIKTIDKHLGEK